jgi:protease-4
MNQFLKQTFASLIGTLAGLILFFVLGTSGLVFLLVTASLKEESPSIKDGSVLVFDLGTQIKDTTSPRTLLREAISEETTSTLTLRQVLEAIEKATQDNRIVAIFLDGRGGNANNGYATLTEIRTALEKFRAAGKKIIAYNEELNEKNYYLASTANHLILNPMGVLEINGLASQPLFLTGALEKYGIGIQVIRVGSYKSAVEPFTRKNFSPESREQTQALLSDIWNNFLAVVSKNRQLSPQNLQAIADNQGFLNSQQARNSKLIDRVAYFDEVLADLQEISGDREGEEDNSFRQISLKNYLDVPLKNFSKSSKNKIAIVYAEGRIVNGQGDIREEEIGSERLTKQLRQLQQDKAIKAVVLRINSPGGSATASEVILREIQRVRAQKPVIVSMGNTAASGGYWIALGGDRIFADADTITGSIGVFGLLPNFEKIANNNGLTWDLVKTAKLADITSVTRPKTTQELAIYQTYVNQTYNLFLEKVAQSRKLAKAEVEKIAQGRVWSGEDAKKIGLVDQIGGLQVALGYAAEKAQLGNDWEVEEYPVRRSFGEEIIEKIFQIEAKNSQENLDILTQEFRNFKEELSILQTLNDPRGVYSSLPFNLRID